MTIHTHQTAPTQFVEAMRPIRVGLIGAGNWAHHGHLPVLTLLPEYEMHELFFQAKLPKALSWTAPPVALAKCRSVTFDHHRLSESAWPPRLSVKANIAIRPLRATTRLMHCRKYRLVIRALRRHEARTFLEL